MYIREYSSERKPKCFRGHRFIICYISLGLMTLVLYRLNT